MTKRRTLVFACAACLAAALGAADDRSAAEPGAAIPRRAQNEALAAHLKQAFEDGFVAGAKRLHAAQKQLDLARKAAPNDPRIEYAAGLILMKQLQNKPAMARFEAALKLDKSGYWPAREGVLWMNLAEKQFDTGLKQLDEFAQTVEEAESPDEISEEQRDAARWVGQVFEALLASAEPKKTHDQIASHEEHLLETFGDELSESFESGREAVRDRVFELEQESGIAQAAADRNTERRKKDKADKLAKEIEGLGKAKETAAKTAEEWKDWLDDFLAKADKQLGLLERDYNFLNQRLASLSQSMTLLGQQITALGLTANANQQQNSTFQQTTQLQLMQAQNQMFGYQLDYNATLGRMSGIAEQGAQVADQRAEAVKRYESETGQLAKKGADLDKWSDRLKNQKQKLTVQKPAAKAGKKGVQGKKQRLTFKTLFPLDLERERDHLLATLAPPL